MCDGVIAELLQLSQAVSLDFTCLIFVYNLIYWPMLMLDVSHHDAPMQLALWSEETQKQVKE